MIKSFELPIEEDLSDFVLYLKKRGIHRFFVTEERGKQIVWVVDHDDREKVAALYRTWSAIKLEHYPTVERSINSFHGRDALRSVIVLGKEIPIVFSVVVFSMIITFILFYIPILPVLHYLSFTGLQDIYADGGVGWTDKFLFLRKIVTSGALWRLITPVFLHFSFLHIVGNITLFIYLGNRLERQYGSLRFGMLFLFLALCSNIVQYCFMKYGVFGGLSGVVYGLIGVVGVHMRYQKIDYGIPSGIYVMMLFWLVLGYTGLLKSLGLGSIANASHTSGLVVGMLIGFLYPKKITCK